MATDAQSPFKHVGFSFEKNFNVRSWHEFFEAHWTYSIYIGFVYLVVVFGLMGFMKDRPALILNRPLTLLYLIMAVMSGYSTYRLWQDYFLYRSLRLAGSSVCQDYSCNTGVYGLPTIVFCFVKTLMLVETVFIVLSTHRAPFVQWYHHVTMLILTWYCAGNSDSVGRYTTMANCTTDAILFGYRFLNRTRLVRINPRAIIILRIIALAELAAHFVANYVAYHYHSGGEFATKSDFMQQVVMFATSSYFVSLLTYMILHEFI